MVEKTLVDLDVDSLGAVLAHADFLVKAPFMNISIPVCRLSVCLSLLLHFVQLGRLNNMKFFVVILTEELFLVE